MSMMSGHTGAEVEEIERYLVRLRIALGDLDADQKQEILQEIRSHILERLEDVSQPLPVIVADTLGALGHPESLAQAYRSEGLLQKAAHSFSPLLLLKATLRWAMTAVRGFLVFMVLSVGYTMAASFYGMGLLKPFFPDQIGLWYFPPFAAFGVLSDSVPLAYRHELLGMWLPPVALALGTLSLVATTRMTRRLIRRFGGARQAQVAARSQRQVVVA